MITMHTPYAAPLVKPIVKPNVASNPRARHRRVSPLDAIRPAEAITLAGLLHERVRRTPNAIAYRQFDSRFGHWVEFTWADTQRAVTHWASALQASGLQFGDRVAVMLPNCREWMVFEQAALSLGLVVVPIYLLDRAANVAYCLNDCAAKVLLIQGKNQWQMLSPKLDTVPSLHTVLSLEVVPEVDDHRLQTVSDWLAPVQRTPLLPIVRPEDLATIVYTSGTVGKPKGVMLNHRSILENAWSGFQHGNVYPSDVFLSFLPLSHMLERTVGYYLPMLAGATVVYVRSLHHIAQDLMTIKPTILISVPRVYERVYHHVLQQTRKHPRGLRWLFCRAVSLGWETFEWRQKRQALRPQQLLLPLLRPIFARPLMRGLGGRLRIAVSGGAPLSDDVARLFCGLGVNLLQGYGLTEASPVISVNQVNNNLPASVGTALPDLEVKIGANDELLVRGASVMQGYWRNPAATRQVLTPDGWLHTGDKARIDEGGHIFITGLIKEIVVLTTGEKVPPADLERAILHDALFQQVIVLGYARPYLSALVRLDAEVWRSFAETEGLPPDVHLLAGDNRIEALLRRRINDLLEEFPGYARIQKIAIVSEPWDEAECLDFEACRAQVALQLREQVDLLYARN